jgi:hypothetical protein
MATEDAFSYDNDEWFYKAVKTKTARRVKPEIKKEWEKTGQLPPDGIYEYWVRRSSLFAPKQAAVVYTPNKMVRARKWLEAEQYGLTVFDTMKHLDEFLGKQKNLPYQYEIWACAVEHPRWVYEERSRLERYYLRTKRRFEEFMFNLTCTREGHKWPEGTVMCDRVKLVYCVERHITMDDKFPVVIQPF